MSVTAQLNVTPDGFCNHDDVVIDDDFMRFAVDCVEACQTLVLGRKTYELFVAHWPDAANDTSLPEWEQRLGRAIDGTPRTVVSNSLSGSDWKGTSILRDLNPASAEHVRRSGAVLVLGSPSIIAQFAGWGLLDNVLLSVHPVMGRTGTRPFAKFAPEEMHFARSYPTGPKVMTFEFTRETSLRR
ncbi:hypothetical protein E2A64_16075 [Pseudohoeflea suaedae]|uniref:Dihydrofolate reductase n=1 Tax=Pseudohoeflea suaedae TaxID=877384 RepID=A0A4R5PH38_9HYPH|nr:dihydrofolate reductase family protein [Pseudohoeflea suaedae]TDH34198.1 hypothetical protein E2A64_16075 [Pseudohoeflea suaedae]